MQMWFYLCMSDIDLQLTIFYTMLLNWKINDLINGARSFSPLSAVTPRCSHFIFEAFNSMLKWKSSFHLWSRENQNYLWSGKSKICNFNLRIGSWVESSSVSRGRECCFDALLLISICFKICKDYARQKRNWCQIKSSGFRFWPLI